VRLTFDPELIRSDGGALDADVVFFNRVSALDGDLVVSLVTVLNTQVVNVQLNVQEWEDQFFLDQIPDDSTHKRNIFGKN
jgi:hypothetical protein